MLKLSKILKNIKKYLKCHSSVEGPSTVFQLDIFFFCLFFLGISGDGSGGGPGFSSLVREDGYRKGQG